MSQMNSDLVWALESPGVWRRGVDEIETFYATMAAVYEASGRMFFAITGHVSLTIEAPSNVELTDVEKHVDTALQKAWVSLRHAHPSIAAQVTQDPKTDKWTKTYSHIKDDTERDSWVTETVVFVSNGQTGRQWANCDPPAPKLPTLFVLQLSPEVNEKGNQTIRRDLVFRSPHDMIDGIGTLILLNTFTKFAADAYEQGNTYQVPALDGSETQRLSPCYRVAANVLTELSAAQKQKLADMSAQRAAVASEPGIEILSLPHRQGAVLPGRHQRAALYLTKEETSSLISACRAIRATPTHVFHAAAAIVVRDRQPRPTETKACRYINYILCNERSKCAEPYNTAAHPATLYHSVSGPSLIVDLPLYARDVKLDDKARKKEFSLVMETVRQFYREVREDTEHYQLSPAMWAMGTPPTPSSSERPVPVPGPKPHAAVSISSMGQTDRIVAPRQGAFRAHDPWVTGEELGNGLGLFLGTFEGEMCLSAAYNDAWHTPDDVDGYLEQCKAIVFEGLGLE